MLVVPQPKAGVGIVVVPGADREVDPPRRDRGDRHECRYAVAIPVRDVEVPHLRLLTDLLQLKFREMLRLFGRTGGGWRFRADGIPSGVEGVAGWFGVLRQTQLPNAIAQRGSFDVQQFGGA